MPSCLLVKSLGGDTMSEKENFFNGSCTILSHHQVPMDLGLFSVYLGGYDFHQ